MALVPLATIRRINGRWMAEESNVLLDDETGDLHAIGGVVTAEGGFAVPMINKTGAPSVKGSCVTAGEAVQNSFVLETSQFAAIGYVYESGVADGAECLVVKSGKAKVLLKDGTVAIRGYLIRPSSDTPGRVEAVVPPSGVGAQATSDHFKEAGHCLENQDAGVDVLALVSPHLN